MNTANLQLEGLLVAMTEMSRALLQAGILPRDSFEDALSRAEDIVTSDEARTRQLSDSQIDAMLFPIRYLALASRGSEPQSFTAVTTEIGRLKSACKP